MTLAFWVGCTVKTNNLPGANDPLPDAAVASDAPEGNQSPTCSEDKDCGQGGHCAQGVCCNTACDGVCESCNLPGTMGTCSAVPEGLPPPRGRECARANVGTCGQDGTCNGTRGCRKYPDNTPCGMGACEGARIVGAKQCQGGACVTRTDRNCAPFLCDSVTSSCLESCVNDTQCTGGRACKDGSCGKRPLESACQANADCESGNCSDGVCCNTACDGPCVTCKDPSSPGQCVPVKKGLDDPRKICAKSPVASCGLSGQCNGQGSCARYEPGTVCMPGNCSGGSYMSPATCNSQGSCVLGMAIACAPYMCQGNACKNECASNSDCVAPATCNDRSCGKRGLGQTCTATDQCGSGFCVDGVCCEQACEGKCLSCAMPSSPGRCVAVPSGTPDPRYAAGERDPAKVCSNKGPSSCDSNGMCNGAGGCEVYSRGTVCKPGSCNAVTNAAEPQSTCDGNGTCMSSPSLSCAPFKCNANRCADICGSDADCTPPSVCRAGSCGKKGNGQVCSQATECASGTCAQGVCCSTACAKGCFSCALPGKEGSCSAVPNGAVDPTASCKATDPQTCGTDGTCNGSGGCRLFSEATICKQANCSQGQSQSTSYCSGSGVCITGSGRECEPYVCNAAGTGCIDSCSSSDQCSAGNSCINGRCGTKGLGATCVIAGECASGFCRNGVCCDQACTGTCKACNLSGAVGVCTNVPQGSPDKGGSCAVTPTNTCGTDGMCDGQGGCQRWGANTMCSSAMCAAGTSTLKNPGFCNGAGTCVAGSQQSCGDFQCNASNASCKTSCTLLTALADCKLGVPCTLSGGKFTCGAKPQGSGCDTTDECSAGLTCVDRTCCASPSCGTCQSCKNSAGTCQNLPDGSDDTDSCKADNATCGLIGKCNGAGSCKQAPAGTVCGNKMCTADGNSEIYQGCDGSGACKAETRPCANNMKCISGACKTRCDSNADCQSGYKCPGKSGMCK